MVRAAHRDIYDDLQSVVRWRHGALAVADGLGKPFQTGKTMRIQLIVPFDCVKLAPLIPPMVMEILFDVSENTAE